MVIGGQIPGLEEAKVTVFDSLTYSGTLTNLESIMGSSRLTFVEGDIRDTDATRAALTGHDAVVHFAAESHVDRSVLDSRVFVETNVLGTHNLLDQSAKLGVSRFLHISTDEVYGSIDHGSWDEDQPLLPNSPYSASKASSDLLVRSYHVTHGLNVSITRCSNNYGPHHFPEKMIPLFITNLLDAKKVPLYGDGGNSRDWLHVDDHCRGIGLVLQDGLPGEIYNIGGGTELTNNELTKLILKATSRDESFVNPVEDRKGHDRRYSVDISKISNFLGYVPQVSFKEGLEEVVRWYQANRSWWEPLKSRAKL